MSRILERIIRVFLSVALLALTASGAGAEEIRSEYSLDQLIAVALKKAESIDISKEELYFAEKQVDRARAVLFPMVSAMGDYKQYTESDNITQPDSSISWGARLDQSFSLSGRELTAFKVAKMGVKKGRFDLYAVKEDYIFKVAEAFYNVLRAKKALEVSRANQKRLIGHKDVAQAKVEVGAASKTALLRAEAELASAVSGMVRAEGNLRLSKAILASLAAIDGDYEIRSPETSEASFNGCIPGNSAALDCLKNMASSKRADLRSVALQKDISTGYVKYAKGAYWPTVSIEGVYLKNEVDPSIEFFADETIYGGVTLSVPIFDWGLRKAELRQARARERQAKLALSNAEKSVYVKVENAYLDFISQGEILVSSRRQLDFAKKNYEVVETQFDVGLASSIDVMDANALLVSSERQAIDAELGYQLSVLRLKREIGTLLKTYRESNE
jgi:outer membrane protein